VYAIVDCNNFYASCERAFAPQLRNRPVVVLSNNDGCVIARSNEVKSFIPMGAVYFKYRPLLKQHKVAVFSANFALYGDMSHRVMTTLQSYSSQTEIYSIDEAFLQLADVKKGYQTLAKAMRLEVLQKTQIPVSIGIASTKTLAKVANYIAKKFPKQTNNAYILNSADTITKALHWLPIGKVWGIGRQHSKRLQTMGVHTAYDYTQLSDSFVKKQFTKVGLELKRELQGISQWALELPSKKKSIAVTRSFAESLTEFDALKERITVFASECAKKLRKQQMCCQKLMVFIHTNHYKTAQPQHSQNIVMHLLYASNSDFAINQQAIDGLKQLYQRGYHYKKAGVIVSGLVPQQPQLFAINEERQRAVLHTVDAINERYGRCTVLGQQNIPKQWIMRQQHLSKRYTTHWNELLEV